MGILENTDETKDANTKEGILCWPRQRAYLIKLEICQFLYVIVFTNIRNATREVLSVTTRFLQRRPLWRKCTEVGTLDEPTLFGNSYMR